MRWLDVLLIGLTVLFMAFAAYGHESSAVRDGVCEWTRICFEWDSHRAWLASAYEIGIGGLLALFFYCLLVWIPERRKRRRIRRSLARHYQWFKSDCIAVFLGLVHGSYDTDLVDTLLNQREFRQHFNQRLTTSEDRWDRFANELDEERLQELLTAMELFRDEISYTLNNVDMPSDRPFEFFKRLSAAIYKMRNTTLDYDSIKWFSNFLWSIFSGFDLVTGYRKEDVIEEMIRSI